MSLMIFKIYIDFCLKTWQRKWHNMDIPLGSDVYLSNLLFVDDYVIVTLGTEDTDVRN